MGNVMQEISIYAYLVSMDSNLSITVVNFVHLGVLHARMEIVNPAKMDLGYLRMLLTSHAKRSARKDVMNVLKTNVRFVHLDS